MFHLTNSNPGIRGTHTIGESALSTCNANPSFLCFERAAPKQAFLRGDYRPQAPSLRPSAGGRAAAFASSLTQFRLHSQYPLLAHRLHTGFLVGDFPPLTCTITPPNHTGACKNLEFVCTYAIKEVSQRRMSGSYTHSAIRTHLGLHFITSPLSIVPKGSSAGDWRLIVKFGITPPERSNSETKSKLDGCLGGDPEN